MTQITARIADWNDPADCAACQAVRRAVFIVEQRVPESEEWDANDAASVHVLATDPAGKPIGTGRLLPDSHIGRVAVLAAWRGKGVGDLLMRELLTEAHARGDRESVLSAQVAAIPFYERFGYRVEGEPYDECGIPHRRMRLALGPLKRAAGLDREGPPSEVRRVYTAQQGVDAALEIARHARYRLAILTPDFEPATFATPEFRDEVRRIARTSRFAHVRILVRDSQRAVREGHHLVEIASQLASYVRIRVPNPDDEQRSDAFVIGDDDAIFYRVGSDSPDGIVEVGGSALARERLRAFDRAWERAEPDPSFRRLGI